MNIKRFIGAVVVTFFVFKAYDVLVHGVLLDPAYQAVSSIWRPNIESKFWLMHLNSGLLAFLFVLLFVRAPGRRGILAGIRHGLVFWLLVSVGGAISQYVAYPVPFEIAVNWILCGGVQFLACGVFVSLICRDPSSPASTTA